MRKWIAAAAALLALCLPARAEEAVTLGAFTVTCPEGWTLGYEQRGVDASLYMGEMDAYVYLRVTDIGGEVSMLPLLTAMGNENAARMFASAMFSCKPENLTAAEAGGCPAVRGTGRVNGVDAAFAAVKCGDWILALAGSAVTDLEPGEALDAALACVTASETEAGADRTEKTLGGFLIPCPEGAAWREAGGQSFLVYDDGLITVSVQVEVEEGLDTVHMADTLGTEAFLESAAGYFGGKRVVLETREATAPEGAQAVRASIDAAALYENMIKRSAENLQADFGVDVEGFTAEGLLLVGGEYEVSIIAISGSAGRSASDVIGEIEAGVQKE